MCKKATPKERLVKMKRASKFVSLVLALALAISLLPTMSVFAANPYLPLNVYVPDSEPRVFGDRVYIYGSWDNPTGSGYCSTKYHVYSASVDDLTNWTDHGIAFSTVGTWPDPNNPGSNFPDSVSWSNSSLYAPDCIQGKDGKYYLYYCLSGASTSEVTVNGVSYPGGGGIEGVAVSDRPEGPFTDLGPISMNGYTLRRIDCAIFKDDDGKIYYYWGQFNCEGAEMNEDMQTLKWDTYKPELIFGAGPAPLAFPDAINTPQTDPLNMRGIQTNTATRATVPSWRDNDAYQQTNMSSGESQYAALPGTAGAEFAFHEGPSMRKINGKYYLIYSSTSSLIGGDRRHGGANTLDYAVADHPLGPFTYGGTIVNNRYLDPNSWNNHGSLVSIKGEWYAFFHSSSSGRQNRRQARVEKIQINTDGSIKQAEMTSLGFQEYLDPYKVTEASWLCDLYPTNPTSTNHDSVFKTIRGSEADGFIFPLMRIHNGNYVGYKYYEFGDNENLSLQFNAKIRTRVSTSRASNTNPVNGLTEASTGRSGGAIEIREYTPGTPMTYGEMNGRLLGTLQIPATDNSVEDKWETLSTSIDTIAGRKGIYLVFKGEEGAGNVICELDSFQFTKDAITSVTVGVEQLTAGYAANVPVTVAGENLGDVNVKIVSKDGQTVYGEANMIGAGMAVVRIDAAKNITAGVYNVVVTADGAEKIAELKVVAPSESIWSPALIAVSDKLAIKFSEEISANTTKFGVKVSGIEVSAAIVADNTVLTSRDYSSLKSGDRVVISGIKYPALFPSYSFTFTINYAS